MDAEEFQRQLQFGHYGGMGIIHERHVAIYQLIDNPESFSEMPFSRSAVTQISCAENDVANTYFKRASDPNFKRLRQEFKVNGWPNKFSKNSLISRKAKKIRESLFTF